MNAMRTLNATQLSTNTTGYPVTGTPSTVFWDNMVKSMNLTPVTSELLKDRLGTDTDWFLGDIEKTICYRENWPLEVTQAPPGHDDEFDRDIVAQFKASERGTTDVQQPRASVRSSQ
jgi:hypothetical protein